MKRVSTTVIPAQPGFSIVQPRVDSDVLGKPIVGLWRTPVVAWCIEIWLRDDETYYKDVSPIGPESWEDPVHPYAIEYPNGMKDVQDEAAFEAGPDGEANLIAYWQAERERDLASGSSAA